MLLHCGGIEMGKSWEAETWFGLKIWGGNKKVERRSGWRKQKSQTYRLLQSKWKQWGGECKCEGWKSSGRETEKCDFCKERWRFSDKLMLWQWYWLWINFSNNGCCCFLLDGIFRQCMAISEMFWNTGKSEIVLKLSPRDTNVVWLKLCPSSK